MADDARHPLDIVQLKLRMPLVLRQMIGERAEKNRRSLNGEIVITIEKSLMIGDMTTKLEQLHGRIDKETKECIAEVVLRNAG